tara:strand:+ start:9695 stop:11326 length:1632 start_codon:yes stop_codon:yes gene_type:complete
MARAIVWAITMLLACGSAPVFSSDISTNNTSEDETLTSLLNALNTRSFDDKADAARSIAKTSHPRRIAVLNALLEGQIYVRKKTDQIVIATRQDREYLLTDVISGEEIGPDSRRSVKKVTVNNRLRRIIRSLIAGLQLNAPDPQARLAAVEEMSATLDADTIGILIAHDESERDDDVKEAIAIVRTIYELQAEDPNIRLAAVQVSGSNVSAEVRIRLTKISENPDETPEIKAAAHRSLKRINQTLDRYAVIETLFFGLSLGSILVLAAIGLSITFGVMGVINMAHGELMMLGAYTTYVIQLMLPDALGYSLLIAVPAAFIVSGLVGIAIERGIIQFLYGRPLETLLATFGVSLALQQAVRSIFSPLNRSVASPEWMSGSLEIVQGLSITYSRLYIFIFTLIVFAALLLVMQRTRLGLEVRAVTQNRAMAKAMGINTTRVDILTFGLGAGIAGVAGVAMSQLTNVGPNLGQGYIVDSFMVVVFGGVGNLWGTLVAGLSLGLVNKILEPMAGAVVAKILVLVFIILFIQKRPRGLFPQKGRAADT